MNFVWYHLNEAYGSKYSDLNQAYGFVLTHLNGAYGFVWTHLNGAYGFVLSYPMFHVQSAPTRLSQSGFFPPFSYAILQEKRQQNPFKIEWSRSPPPFPLLYCISTDHPSLISAGGQLKKYFTSLRLRVKELRLKFLDLGFRFIGSSSTIFYVGFSLPVSENRWIIFRRAIIAPLQCFCFILQLECKSWTLQFYAAILKH